MAAPHDHWQSDIYSQKVANYVPLLTQKVVSWLDPQPQGTLNFSCSSNLLDRVLDFGAGDGILTAKLAKSVAAITALDSSGNLLAALNKSNPEIPTVHLDGRELLGTELVKDASFNKVFSNAAMHWILADSTKRADVIKGVHRVLEPNGLFVAEAGGMGNIATVHTAMISALVHRGITHAQITKANPWWFPSVEAMQELLENNGFKWERGELELRQTVLTTHEEGGVAGWIRLFGDPYLSLLKTDKEKEEVIQECAEVLEHVGRRQDGAFILDYIRIRYVARKV
jgi:trans-aconitate methyltransferase